MSNEITGRAEQTELTWVDELNQLVNRPWGVIDISCHEETFYHEHLGSHDRVGYVDSSSALDHANGNAETGTVEAYHAAAGRQRQNQFDVTIQKIVEAELPIVIRAGRTRASLRQISACLERLDQLPAALVVDSGGSSFFDELLEIVDAYPGEFMFIPDGGSARTWIMLTTWSGLHNSEIAKFTQRLKAVELAKSDALNENRRAANRAAVKYRSAIAQIEELKIEAMEKLESHGEKGPPEEVDLTDASEQKGFFGDGLRWLRSLFGAQREGRTLALPSGSSVTGEMSQRPRVACILDDFSESSFSPEGDFLQLTPDRWKLELRRHKPELLFVESAWRGKEGAWGRKLATRNPEIVGIIDWCRQNKVPTVFWNKEDPVHYSGFLPLARLFDVVMTTDVDCVPRYKKQLGHDRVYFMPFAAQPAIYNPIQTVKRLDGFCFAGSYYARYPDRTRDLDSFEVAFSQEYPFAIFDRMYHSGDPDFEFPRRYRRHILGTLKPAESDLAYKGYRWGINLNSVKSSQSMFARRVFELIASNTLVVSNYSRGLSNMFGDLVVDSDSGSEALRELDAISYEAFGEARLRNQALRKVLREHTYRARMEFICSVTGVQLAEAANTAVVLLPASNSTEYVHQLDSFNRQSWPELRPIVVSSDRNVNEAASLDGIQCVSSKTLLSSWSECSHNADYLTVFHPNDHYADTYVEDLLVLSRELRAPIVGMPPLFELRGSELFVNDDIVPYCKGALLTGRSMLLKNSDGQHISDFLESRVKYEATGLSASGIGYLRYGRRAPDDVKISVGDLQVSDGKSLSELQEYSQSLVYGETQIREFMGPSQLHSIFSDAAGRRNDIEVQLVDGALRMSSSLDTNVHQYLYASERVLISDLPWSNGEGCAHLKTNDGANVQAAILFYDSDDTRIGHAMIKPHKNCVFRIPDNAAEALWALRVQGSGVCDIEELILEPWHETGGSVLLDSELLVLTNTYPSYTNLYRNGFVHRRVKNYKKHGVGVEVCVLSDQPSPVFREFEGQTVMEINHDRLTSLLASGSVRKVLVHFFDERMWNAINESGFTGEVLVWIHGSEVQPWWRREYNYEGDVVGLEKAKEMSADRLRFWKMVFSSQTTQFHFIFVSEYFANEVFEDVGMRLEDSRYDVIPNPIDTDVFQYSARSEGDRLKIVSIRPYASRKYANDLSVKAVLDLSSEPFFEELEFLFVGDGPLFDDITEPLRQFANVTVRRGFLSQPDMAAVYRDHGVVLTPTRMDAQGVSRDEAMSCGLVPVTTDVAAVPEFVDSSCGFLAPLDDHVGLANAIREIYGDPSRYLQLSKAAAERVGRQSGIESTIGRELSSIDNSE